MRIMVLAALLSGTLASTSLLTEAEYAKKCQLLAKMLKTTSLKHFKTMSQILHMLVYSTSALSDTQIHLWQCVTSVGSSANVAVEAVEVSLEQQQAWTRVAAWIPAIGSVSPEHPVGMNTMPYEWTDTIDMMDLLGYVPMPCASLKASTAVDDSLLLGAQLPWARAPPIDGVAAQARHVQQLFAADGQCTLPTLPGQHITSATHLQAIYMHSIAQHGNGLLRAAESQSDMVRWRKQHKLQPAYGE